MTSLRNCFDIRRFPKEKKRRFLFDIILGLLFVILFALTRDTSLRQALINDWFDSHISFRANTMNDLIEMCPSLHTIIASGADEKAEDLTFLAFSESSVRKMGHPDFIPRDKIAELVNIAYKQGAKLIILDMLLNEPDNTPERMLESESMPMSGRERDERLRTVLQQIKNDNNSDTKVLIPLASYHDKTLMRNILLPSGFGGSNLPETGDGLIDGKKIYAVTPNVTVSQTTITRFWLPYSIIKTGNGKRVLWSIPMMTLCLLHGTPDDFKMLERQILDDAKQEMFTLNLSQSGKDTKFVFYREHPERDGYIRDASTLQYNRIQYGLIPPDVTEKDTAPKSNSEISPRITPTRNPLGNIKETRIGHWRNNESHLDNKNFDCKGKIVIIGREDRDSGDIFHTLTGNMPGMYVHGNSVATVLAQTHPHLAPTYKQVIADLSLVIITAYAFLHLGTLKGGYIVFLLIGIFWAFSYVYFLMTNELLYISFAFTSIGVYTWLNNIETFFEKGKSIKEIIWRDENE